MVDWIFSPNTVREAPFAWNSLHERFSMNRGVSIFETAPGVWEEMRYDAYTNELGALNLQPQANANSDFWPQPREGLHYFRGGYEWRVSDEVKTSLLASGLVTEDNFTIPDEGFGGGGFGFGGFGL